jgi:hypothetical protein
MLAAIVYCNRRRLRGFNELWLNGAIPSSHPSSWDLTFSPLGRLRLWPACPPSLFKHLCRCGPIVANLLTESTSRASTYFEYFFTGSHQDAQRWRSSAPRRRRARLSLFAPALGFYAGRGVALSLWSGTLRRRLCMLPSVVAQHDPDTSTQGHCARD